jgi:hypothetical protein
MAFGMCESCCRHGGCCVLSDGHDGDHDSGACTWTDAEAASKAEADAMVIAEGWAWLVDFQRALEALDGS